MTANTTVTLDRPPVSVPRFEVAEFVVRVDQPDLHNPFTEAELSGEFKRPDKSSVYVNGFADSQDGRVFRLRFSPEQSGITYKYTLQFRAPRVKQTFKGELRSESSSRSGPAIVNPQRPKHFMFAGTGQPVYILGYTAYHLLDPSNNDAQVDATIDYCAREGFNRIRFLLTGYPRDSKGYMAKRIDPNSADPERRPNYGEKPGRVNPLPAWLGTPHAYDFTRFHIAYWQRVERAVRRMRERGIFADCIFTIEKQDLPMEYGRLTDNEVRLYRYGIARLAAFDNVWWDLGNEHNEYRDVAWGNAMGALVKALDPYRRLASVNAYEEFLYPKSDWPDLIMTQQYGDEKQVNDWALKYLDVPKPYINEEYGYEGYRDKPGHLQNADWVRRSHWSIAMAGGYATYGDWSNGVSYFYMGVPGPGVVAGELKHLRKFFEALPFTDMVPNNKLTDQGFCLARVPDVYVFYFPRGGNRKIDLTGAPAPIEARWFDPRTGEYRAAPEIVPGTNMITVPAEGHRVLVVRHKRSSA